MLLYLHIPFCDSKCHYCAFNSYTSLHQIIPKYMHAITQQLHFELSTKNIQKNSIDSVFIGGGTPSTVPPKLYKIFFKTLAPYLKKDAEITSEANPNSATHIWLEGMQSLGVNRISFGVQSFYKDKLALLGRAHNGNEAIKAVQNAYELGFENISIDLMYGTKLDTKERLEHECKTALSLPINHISSYSLTIEEGTPFAKNLHVSKDDEKLAHFFANFLNTNGFEQYEVSNFGTYKCRHNLGYWQHKPYLGIGAGAVGFDGKHRFYPNKNVVSYINEPTFCENEPLHSKDLLLEKIFLGFRSTIGVKKELLNPEQNQKAGLLVKEKKLTCKNETYYAKDFFLADELALFIY